MGKGGTQTPNFLFRGMNPPALGPFTSFVAGQNSHHRVVRLLGNRGFQLEKMLGRQNRARAKQFRNTVLQALPGDRESRSKKMFGQLSGANVKHSRIIVLRALPDKGGSLWNEIWNLGVKLIDQLVEMAPWKKVWNLGGKLIYLLVVMTILKKIWDLGVEKTFELAGKEIKFLMEAPDEVKSVKQKLEYIKSDLKKADSISDKEEDTWVSQLRVLAFMVEDVTEVFENNKTTYSGYDVCKVISGTWCQLKTLHKLKGEIENFNLKHAELPEEKPEFKERSREDGETEFKERHRKDGETSNTLREEGGPSSETKEDDIVGFIEEKKQLTLWLTENHHERRIIVSIWGTGGTGKTSLAHKIYKNSFVTSQFDCVAWATVSQKCDVKDISVAILEQIRNLTEEEKEELKTEHIDIVRKKVDACLKEKDYLIILDDVWKGRDFDELMKAFPESPDKKCRILVTARTEEVGGLAKYRLPLQGLNVKEGEDMVLFLKKVYQSAPGEIQNVSEEQMYLARKILEICKGLPMAIVILGGMLQSNRDETDVWRRLSDGVQSELKSSGEIVGIRKVIAQSYIDLPCNLRSCFLYFGLFPEDSMIDCDKLIRLWLAEGFLEQQGHNDDPVEYVAKQHLDDLIERSMIQVVQRKSNGKPQICCTHDLIRDFAKHEAEKALFSKIFKQQPLPSVEGIRRIALHPKDTQDQISGTSSSVLLRSRHLSSNRAQSSLRSSRKEKPSASWVEGLRWFCSSVLRQSKASSLSDPQSSLPSSRKRTVAVEGDDLVGVDDKVDKLVSWLQNEEPLGRFGVVSIVGEDGIGKTAVAQKVYETVESIFDCRAWVHVSRTAEPKHIVWVILKQFTSLTDAVMKREEESLRMFDELLETKNCLIVLDNLSLPWDWDAVKTIFPNPLKVQKCRVLLTFMYPANRFYADRLIAVVQLRRLDKDPSLTLFLKTIFKCSQREIPKVILSKEMKDMATKMAVEYCEGLPSAILALGSLLSEKEVANSVWNETIESLNEVKGVRCGVNKVFRVCYLDLTVHLRSCIRCFSCLYSNDVADIKTLVKYWDACLLKSDNNESIEDDVARDCQELIQRKLIDVVKAGRSTDPHHMTQTYMMQPAFDQFLRSSLSMINKLSELAEDSQPLPYYDDPKESARVQYGTSTAPPPDHSKPKTFSVSHLISYLRPTKYNGFPNHVHSFLCFSKNPQFGDEQFPLLRVVDLEGAERMKKVPNAIEKLILLRYLSLRGTGVREIPRWIAYLDNLQTLDAPNSNIPIEALHLPKLRYLFAASFYGPSSATRLRIGLLKQLHTLELDTANWIIDGLDELTSLRVLRLHCGEDTVFILQGSNGREVNVFRAVAMLTCLKSLYLSLKQGSSLTSSSSECTDDARTVHSLSFSSHSDLDEMILRGTMVKLPKLSDFPKFVKYLWLETYVDNDMDPFSALQRLPSLKKLCLRLFKANDKVKSKMICHRNGFPELEYLYVSVDFWIESTEFAPFTWTVEEGAFRNLKVLHIEGNGPVGLLRNLPVGLRHVRTLKELILTRCYDVRVNLVHRKGKNWEEVKDMQSLSIKFFNESNMKP